MQFLKRRGKTKAKVVPSDLQALEAQFVGDIRLIVIFQEYPSKAHLKLGPKWTKLCSFIILSIEGEGSTENANCCHR